MVDYKLSKKDKSIMSGRSFNYILLMNDELSYNDRENLVKYIKNKQDDIININESRHVVESLSLVKGTVFVLNNKNKSLVGIVKEKDAEITASNKNNKIMSPMMHGRSSNFHCSHIDIVGEFSKNDIKVNKNEEIVNITNSFNISDVYIDYDFDMDGFPELYIVNDGILAKYIGNPSIVLDLI